MKIKIKIRDATLGWFEKIIDNPTIKMLTIAIVATGGGYIIGMGLLSIIFK